MQWIAMLTMLIDHIGVVFFPDQIMFRIIGRIAFPIYVYLAILGYQRTANFKLYMLRLTLLALLSQLPFQLAFNIDHINVIGTLVVGILLIKCIEHFKQKPYIYILFALLSCLIVEYFNFDYGMYGIALMLLYRYMLDRPALLLLLHFSLELLFMFISNWGIQFLSIFVSTMLVYYSSLITKLDQYRAPKWLWRIFYPVHLTILFLIVNFL